MKKLTLLLLISTFVFANISNDSQKDLQITIYNSDLSLIKESRDFTINKSGKQELVYENVAPKMITDSVIADLGSDISLYSQNYRYDTISLNKILEKLVGKNVSFTDKKDNNKTKTGKLLALNPIIIQTPSKIHHSISHTDIIIKSIPKNLLVHPSLVWQINAKKPIKNATAKLSYLSQGFNWKSDYVVTFENNKLDLIGWITVQNYSGNSFYDARLYTIAGELNRVQPVYNNRVYKQNVMMEDSVMGSSMPQQESFSGYHLYKIPFQVNLLNNEKKQIKFINQKDINAKKIYKTKLYGAINNFGKSKFNFDQYITFENTKVNSLGIPMPKGVIRVYEKDSNGDSLFSGEDRVSHTPKDENITVRIGKEFDIIGERKQTYYKNYKNGTIESSIEYLIKNKKNIPVTVTFTEGINTTRLINDTNCKKRCSYKVVNSNTIEYKVKIDKDSTYTFTSDYEVRY
ncbi:MAG: Unknown protein [uncultured Campylobacterales bacterium]|uniref:DUF4139 domain-containing protein n=1 Tax=uncultured Campylobacterales bacterium TaxID=352960 RepID=A0A6S6SYG2_9BACT|nr:MAG: Unknown protein [uncultured Campylobacterales bacterium]